MDSDNKLEEIVVLKKFIEVYSNYSGDKIKILDFAEAKAIFSDYNGENPDFIIRVNDEHVGIELFTLIRDELETLNRNENEEEMRIRNAAHLFAIRKKNNDPSIYLMEDLAQAAIDRINDKVKNKLKNYVNCKIWLLGCAGLTDIEPEGKGSELYGQSSKAFNFHIMSPYSEDKMQKKVARYISDNILKDDRVRQIWLAEFSNQDLLFRIE